MMIHGRKLIALALAVLIALPAALLSGCSEEESRAQEIMLQALAKQKEVTSYTFAGSANLNIDLSSQAQGGNAIASGLLGMFTRGKLEWSGTASIAPVRLEANLKTTPEEASAAYEFPIMLLDNTLYLHIPLLNKEGEYISADMAELSAAPRNSLLMTIITEGLRQLVTDMNPKWFKEADSATLKDGSDVSVYRLEISEVNLEDLTDHIQGKLPQLAEYLASSGLINNTQAEKMKISSASFRLQAPGVLEIAVDKAGFIRRESMDISYQGGTIRFTQDFNNINEEPKFEKAAPVETKPLEDILKLLTPLQNAQ